MEKQNNLYLLAIVAIVAIIAIVVMILGAEKQAASNMPAFENTALAKDASGQAYVTAGHLYYAARCRRCLEQSPLSMCQFVGYCPD